MKYLNNQQGMVMVLVALMLTAIIGAVALVVDVGVAMAERIELSNSLDAAALAGGQELPGRPALAASVVREYLEANGVDPLTVDISITNNNTKLALKGTKVVMTRFARVLGVNETTVGAQAAIMVGPAVSVKGGLRPLAIVDQPLIYGQEVTLKEGGGDGTSGNYGAVSFGGSYGACIFRAYLENGYPGVIKIGDIIETEPGNMASSISTVKGIINYDSTATFDNYERDSARVWTIPVVDNWDVSGRDTVKVVGFAQFFLENIQKKAGQAEITGKFIRFTTNGEIGSSQTDYGVYGIKMILTPES